MSEDLISVIIPAFNAKKWVAHSVKSVLQQTNVNFECIVIDDGSTDGTSDFLEEKFGKKIYVFKQENCGLSEARNRGAAKAQGDYLAFLDADDLWTSNKLFHQYNKFQKYPHIDAIYCQAFRIDENGRIIPRQPFGVGVEPGDFSLENRLRKRQALALGSTLMIRTNQFQSLGGFDPTLRIHEDFDFSLRMAINGCKQAMVQVPLAYIRYNRNSLSHLLSEKRVNNSLKCYERIVEKIHAAGVGPEAIQLAEQLLVSVRMHSYLYSCYMGKKEQAEKERHAIELTEASSLTKSSLFYNQIKTFTPLLFAIQEDCRAALRFFDLVMEERNRSGKPDTIADGIERLKSLAWCAGQGNWRNWFYALLECYRIIGDTPALIVRPEFWIPFIRLVGGKCLVKLGLLKWYLVGIMNSKMG